MPPPGSSPCLAHLPARPCLVHLPFWFISLPVPARFISLPVHLNCNMDLSCYCMGRVAAVGREGGALHPQRGQPDFVLLRDTKKVGRARACHAFTGLCTWAALDGCLCFVGPQGSAQGSSLGPSSLSKCQGGQGMLASLCVHEALWFQ